MSNIQYIEEINKAKEDIIQKHYSASKNGISRIQNKIMELQAKIQQCNMSKNILNTDFTCKSTDPKHPIILNEKNKFIFNKINEWDDTFYI